jgi:WD40 repeat protein
VFSPDGRLCLTFPPHDKAARPAVQAWDTADGRLIRALAKGDGQPVLPPRFAPDGTRVLVLGPGDRLGWWEPATGATRLLPVPSVKGLHTTFSPRGDRALLYGPDRPADLWDIDRGQRVGPPLPAAADAEFAPDGRRMLLYVPGGVDLYDAVTGRQIAGPLPHVAGKVRPLFSPSGDVLLTRPAADTVRAWDAATGQPLGPPLPHDHPDWPARFSPDGRAVLTLGRDAMVRVFATGGRPLTPPLAHRVAKDDARPVISPDGRLLVTVTGDDFRVTAWDLRSGQPDFPLLKAPFGHSQFARSLTFSPDGRWLLITDQTDGGDPSMLYDARTGWRLAPVPLFSVDSEPFSASGRLLFSTNSGAWSIRDLSPDERPADDLVRLAQLLSGRRLDEGSVLLSPLSADERRDLWQGLRARHPAEFALPDADGMLLWHRVSAASTKDPLGKAWYLDRLIAAEPQSGRHFADRAGARARLGLFDAAEADLRQVVACDADSLLTWHQLALLRLRAGDTAGYRGTCAEMLKRFPQWWANPLTEGVPTIALAACPEPDMAEALRTLRTEITDPKHPHHREMGVVEYRLGRFTEAVKHLEALVEDDLWFNRPYDWLFLAMAHHRAGNVKQARRYFDRVAKDWPPIGYSPYWHPQLQDRLLWAEAEQVLGISPAK